MRSNFKKLSHTLYECKYHIVFCPKYRHRILKGEVADYCRREYFNLMRQKDQVEVLGLNIQADHVHTVVSIPPKYSVSSIMGFVISF